MTRAKFKSSDPSPKAIGLRRRACVAVLVTTLAGTAYAHSGVENPAVMARMHVMKDIAAALETLGDMAKGKRAYDADLAAVSKARLAAKARATAGAFEAPEDDPKSEARAEIWDNWSDFVLKTRAMEDAVAALEVGSAAEIGAGLRPIGQTCTACHRAYRVD